MKPNCDQDLKVQDLNQNGIHDDVDEYIMRAFHQLEQRKAAQQYAFQLQAVLLVDKTEMIRVRRLNFEVACAIACINDAFLDENQVSSNLVKCIEAVATTSKTHFCEKLANPKALDGTSVIMLRDKYCDK